LRLNRQSYTMSFHPGPHLHGIIEAEDLGRIVDEEVKVFREVSREHSANPVVGGLQCAQGLNDRQDVGDGVRTGVNGSDSATSRGG
jgi:hypothetical protein